MASRRAFLWVVPELREHTELHYWRARHLPALFAMSNEDLHARCAALEIRFAETRAAFQENRRWNSDDLPWESEPLPVVAVVTSREESNFGGA